MHSKVILLAAGICDGTMQMWREAQHRCNRIHMPLIGGADYDDHGVVRRLDTDEAYLLINGFARNFRLRPDTRYYHLYLDFQTTPPLAGYGVQTLNVGEDAVTRALLDAVAASVRETDPVRCRILREHTEAFAEIGRILDVLMRRLQRRYAIRTVENPKIQHAVRYIEEHYAERLSNEEIAARLGEKKEAVVRAMEAIIEPISLYEPVYSDSGDSIYVIDQLSDNSSSDEIWLENIALRDAMKSLNERERRIINLRYYKNKTQMEIADEIGISQAQVSRLEKGALEHIRRQF